MNARHWLPALCLAACEATMPPPPAEVPAPAPSGRAQLDDADLKKAMEPLREGMKACIDAYRDPGKPEAIVKIAPTGKVEEAKIYQIYNLSERRCLLRAVRMARFPAFEGPAMTVVLSLKN